MDKLLPTKHKHARVSQQQRRIVATVGEVKGNNLDQVKSRNKTITQ